MQWYKKHSHQNSKEGSKTFSYTFESTWKTQKTRKNMTGEKPWSILSTYQNWYYLRKDGKLFSPLIYKIKIRLVVISRLKWRCKITEMQNEGVS